MYLNIHSIEYVRAVKT